jgi:hypothetical protein
MEELDNTSVETTSTESTESSSAPSSIAELREKVEGVIASPFEDAAVEPKSEKAGKEAVKPEEKIIPLEAVGKPQESAPVEEKPSFMADFKFKAGGKEFEIPEKFRALITDEASQKEVVEIMEKAYGLDDLKPRHLKQKEQLEYLSKEVIPQYQKQDKLINELAKLHDTGDFESFFERLGTDEKKLQEWMYNKLTLTPDQKALHNEKRELQKQLYERETENQALSQTAEAAKREIQQAQEQKTLEALDFTVKNSEHKDVAISFDEMNGEGSFKNKVIQYAAFVEQTEGKVLTPQEAVAGFTKFANITPAMAKPVQSGSQAAPKEKPTLPVTTAKAYSPTGKQVTSIKELRAKANQARAEQ